jgi:adenylate kinase family enzyme
MIESIIIGILTVFLMSSIYLMAALKKQAINLTLQNGQHIIDKKILQDRIVQINEDKKLVESEEFMQFMIASREHAFTYIEAVQESLQEYKKIMDPIISYHNKYGRVLGETHEWQRMEEIAKAYQELLEILPNDGEKK